MKPCGSFALTCALLLGAVCPGRLAGDPPSEVPVSEGSDGFSVVALSDPQFPRWLCRGTGAEGGIECSSDREDTRVCIDREAEVPMGPIFRTGGLCASVRTNDATVDAVNKITDLAQWPSAIDCSDPPTEKELEQGCISRGQGAAITAPELVIMNGDITEFWTLYQVELYRRIYLGEELGGLGGIDATIYHGLGNHDYQSNAQPEENFRARNAVEWMSDRLRDMPAITNIDLQGFITVRNSGLRQLRFRVIFNNTEQKPWQQINAGQRKTYITRRGGIRKVEVQFQRKALIGNGWNQIDTVEIPNPPVSCFRVSDVVLPTACTPNSKPILRGSMSYSFNRGRYHFVQLHNFLSYSANLTNVTANFPHSQPEERLKQKFRIISGDNWLKSDLTQATRAGRAIIINLHDSGRLNPGTEEKQVLKELLTGAENNWNVVAVLSGHVHPTVGLVPPDDAWQSPRGFDIPRLESGGGICGTFLYLDLQADYFNWAALRAWELGSPGDPSDLPPVQTFGQIDPRLFGLGTPQFIIEKDWTCYSDATKPKKQGTVEFAALSPPPGNEPPVAQCADVTVDAGPMCTAEASIDDGSFDPEGGPVSLSQTPPGPYDLGQTEVQLTVVDNVGLAANCEATVTVVEADCLRATFSVAKSYTDGNDAPVEVVLECNTGLPLEQRQVIAPGEGVTFVVRDFAQGEMDCLVTEVDFVAGYEARYDNGDVTSSDGCSFGTVRGGDALSCDIVNSPLPVGLQACKEWLQDPSEFGVAARVTAKWRCENIRTDPSGELTSAEGLIRFVGNECVWIENGSEDDAHGVESFYPNWTIPGSYCTVLETDLHQAVESENGCGNLPLQLGSGNDNLCVIRNTVFAQGIPALSEHLLAALALIVLVIGAWHLSSLRAKAG